MRDAIAEVPEHLTFSSRRNLVHRLITPVRLDRARRIPRWCWGGREPRRSVVGVSRRKPRRAVERWGRGAQLAPPHPGHEEKPGRSTGGEAARARRADLVGLERRDRAAEGRQRIAGRSAAPERPAPAPRPQSPVPCCRPCGRGCSGGRPNLEVPALRGPPGRAVRRGRAAGADAPSGPGLNASKLGRRRGLAGAARKDRAARRRGAPPIISVMGRGRSGGPTPSASSAPCRPSTRPGATSCPGAAGEGVPHDAVCGRPRGGREPGSSGGLNGCVRRLSVGRC